MSPVAIVYLDPVKPVPEVTVAFNCEGGVGRHTHTHTHVTLHTNGTPVPSQPHLSSSSGTSSRADADLQPSHSWMDIDFKLNDCLYYFGFCSKPLWNSECVQILTMYFVGGGDLKMQ